MIRENQDVLTARRVARACKQPFEVIPVGNEFLSRFGHYAERSVYLTDGCTDMNLCPDLYVYERARAIAPIRMSGNYGGEVLRRVRAFKPVGLTAGLFAAEMDPHIRQAEDSYAAVLRAHPLSFGVFRQATWHHYGVLALEQTQMSLRTPYLDNELVRTVFRAPESACSNNDVSLRLIEEGSPVLRKIRTDRGLAGGAGPVVGAASRGLLEFLFKAEYAYDYGMPQWLAKIDHTLAPLHLERLFLGRHKFYHFRMWYRDVLSGFVREMLLDSRSLARPYLNRRQVTAIVEGHTTGTHNYTLDIHKLLTLEYVHRLFVDR
jgi:asparagine synthase (glutamine-hydrolysing)